MVWGRKRKVRVHFKPAVADASVEGILIGQWAGHYRLANARQIEDSERSFNLDGPELLVPRENVLHIQEIA